MNNEIISLAEKLIKFKIISHHYKEIKECAAFIGRYAKNIFRILILIKNLRKNLLDATIGLIHLISEP